MSDARRKRLLNESGAACYLDVSRMFLRKARHKGTIPGKVEGPPFIRVGPRAVRYDIADLDAWIEARRVAK